MFFENIFWTLPVGHSTGVADRGQGASGARGATRVTCFGVLRVLRVPPEYPPVPRGYGVGSKKKSVMRREVSLGWPPCVLQATHAALFV